MEKQNNLKFSFKDLVTQTDNLRNNLTDFIDSNNYIISVKTSFQDEHIIYKCSNLETYRGIINRLENDYNYDNYIITVYKHHLVDGEILTDIIIPRNTTLLENDFIGSLDDLPF